nr:4-carboxy-4-hydroxy-2-oxoadipate aldolase/oxaloacetate decarboxylase [Patulibacter sp. SYSU D01012]
MPDGIGAATLYEAAGRRGALDPAVRRRVGVALAGPALPVACAAGDNLAVHRAVAVAAPGEVLVVAGAGVAVGYLGDVLAVAAQARGVAGAVVDGGVRDLREIDELGFGLWARHVAMAGATKRTPGAVGEPVVCGGVLVRRGDWVVADEDGVAVVPRDDVPAVLDAARRRQEAEERMKRELLGGALTLDLLGLRADAEA